MTSLLQNVRYTFRQLGRNPTFATVAILTLALGIGANAAVFSIVDGVLFRSLPFHEPEDLVEIHGVDRGDAFRPLSLPHYSVIRKGGALQKTVATRPSRETLVVPSERAIEINVARASDDLPAVLGVAPLLGQNPSAADWASGANVLLLTRSLWQSMFGADPGVIGRSVSLNGRPFIIAAVLPANIAYPPGTEAWRPMALEERTDDDPDHAVLARLGDGVRRSQAEGEIRALTRSYLASGANEPAGLNVRIANARDSLVRSVRGPLLMIQGAAVAILLVTCLNVAHLLLARGETRRAELAIRAALGASWPRLLASLVTEAAVLAALGCAAGLLGATLVLPGLLALVPEAVPRLNEITIDGRVLGAMAAVSVVTFVAFSAWPALRAASAPPRTALTGGREGVAKHREWASRALVASQVALSTVLVTAALLLTTSFVQLARADRGFDETSLLYLPVASFPAAVEAAGGNNAYLSALLNTVTMTPGVRAAALTTHPPSSMRALNFRLFGLKGLTVSPGERPTQGGVAVVSHNYFATAGLALIEGRGFTSFDREGTEAVAIVSESFARAYLPDRSPVGAVFYRTSLESGKPTAVRIVAIVEDTRPIPGEPHPELLYLPFGQAGFDPGLLVRTAGDSMATAAALERSLCRLDPTLPTNRLAPLDPPERLTATRFQAWTVGLFAGLALLLAAVGIYGISAYAVIRRRREIGIRRALGATDRSVQLDVLRRAATVTAFGAVVGLLGALLVSDLLSGVVFGVDPLAPAVFVAAAALLATVSILAAWLPARRAARVDPMIAFQAE
ncbi:MAG: FtsX-like permease family protein [Luteitalea sp.]|nr:FtsX-like permease family protein [Luteitalea sp.]